MFSRRDKGKRLITPEEARRFMELKEQGLERVLGPMYGQVLHAIIPFEVGGTLDLYFFTQAVEGTAIATMELIEPDGTGPIPSSKIGTYELVGLTRQKMTSPNEPSFIGIRDRLGRIMNVIARYSYQAELNPFETVQVPIQDSPDFNWVILDEYKRPGVEFKIGKERHGLLLCVEVFESELEYARKNRTRNLIELLKAKGHYPFSDLDRPPVA